STRAPTCASPRVNSGISAGKPGERKETFLGAGGGAAARRGCTRKRVRGRESTEGWKVRLGGDPEQGGAHARMRRYAMARAQDVRSRPFTRSRARPPDTA